MLSSTPILCSDSSASSSDDGRGVSVSSSLLSTFRFLRALVVGCFCKTPKIMYGSFSTSTYRCFGLLLALPRKFEFDGHKLVLVQIQDVQTQNQSSKRPLQ